MKEENIGTKTLGELELEITEQVERAAAEALASREKMPKGETALDGVYANGR